jgi:hypothetical protein
MNNGRAVTLTVPMQRELRASHNLQSAPEVTQGCKGEVLHQHCLAAHMLAHLTVLSMLTDARRSAVVGSHLTIAMELV